MSDLICISHLRWDFVWQRPQHLLSRLAKTHRVLFVEEPIASTHDAEPHLQVIHEPAVTVIRLIQPVAEPRWIGHGDPLTQTTYTRLLNAYLADEQFSDDAIVWLYTPMAADFAAAIPHGVLAFDVMDQLSAFKGAPPELLAQERAVLQQSDIVFTGGISLFRDKLYANPNTHLFPSGVEADHFARAAEPSELATPPDMSTLPNPILGYFGVIDERMDLPLLAHLAAARPEWQIVMIGPVLKIDPAELPHAPNLHYPGMKSYAELPAYLAQFDVALIPFARNEATRFLSPTKTLEYMAAHKPIVSTPIADVIELYGDAVRVADTPDAFVTACEAALNDDPAARRSIEDAYLARHSWDAIAEAMNAVLSTAEKRAAQRHPSTPEMAINSSSSNKGMK